MGVTISGCRFGWAGDNYNDGPYGSVRVAHDTSYNVRILINETGQVLRPYSLGWITSKYDSGIDAGYIDESLLPSDGSTVTFVAEGVDGSLSTKTITVYNKNHDPSYSGGGGRASNFKLNDWILPFYKDIYNSQAVRIDIEGDAWFTWEDPRYQCPANPVYTLQIYKYNGMGGSPQLLKTFIDRQTDVYDCLIPKSWLRNYANVDLLARITQSDSSGGGSGNRNLRLCYVGKDHGGLVKVNLNGPWVDHQVKVNMNGPWVDQTVKYYINGVWVDVGS